MLARAAEHGIDRVIAPAQMGDHRQDDREDDSLLDAPRDDDERGDGCDSELEVVPGCVDLAHPCDVDQLDADQEDHGREDCVRQVLQGPGQE